MKRFNLMHVIVLGSLLTTAGCASFWHDLQPHRLRRLNRVPAPSMDPEFSATLQEKNLPDEIERAGNIIVRAQR